MRDRKNFGYSLAELLLVLVIFGLLSSISLPVLCGIQSRNKLKREQQRLRVALESLVSLSLEAQRESTLLIHATDYEAYGAFSVRRLLPEEMHAESSSETFSFYASGVVSPGSIRIYLDSYQCTLTVSLRGRITESCS